MQVRCAGNKISYHTVSSILCRLVYQKTKLYYIDLHCTTIGHLKSLKSLVVLRAAQFLEGQAPTRPIDPENYPSNNTRYTSFSQMHQPLGVNIIQHVSTGCSSQCFACGRFNGIGLRIALQQQLWGYISMNCIIQVTLQNHQLNASEMCRKQNIVSYIIILYHPMQASVPENQTILITLIYIVLQ